MIVEGLELARSLAGRPALRRLLAPESAPGRSRSSTTSAGAIRNYFHPAGTCGIGRVVDAAGRVLGRRRPRRRGRLDHADHPAREHERDDGRDRRAPRRDDLTVPLAMPPGGRRASSRPMTYSIVAWDPEAGELGVAVQSRAFNTGAACAWALPGVGAVATQSFTERRYGPDGLSLMRRRSASPEPRSTSCWRRGRPRDVRQVAYRRPRRDGQRRTRVRVHPARGRPQRADVQRPGEHAALGRGLAGDGRGVRRDRWIARGAPARGARRRGGGGRRLSRTTGGGARRRRRRARRAALRRARLRPPRRRPRRAAPTSSGASTGWPPDTGAGTASTRAPIRTEERAAALEAGAPRARSPDRRDVRLRAKRRPRAGEVADGRGRGAEPIWRAAFERYEKLGLIPEGRRAGRTAR